MKIQDMELQFEDSIILFSSVPEFPIGRSEVFYTKLLTVYFDFSSFDEIVNAYLKSKDIAEKIAARICLIGYCITLPPTHVITTINQFEIGNDFKVLLSSGIKHKRTYECEISKDSLALCEPLAKLNGEECYIELSLGYFWKAIYSESLEEKILMLSVCLEKIGSNESQDFVKKRCSKCEHEEITNIKATKKYLKNLLMEIGGTGADINNFLDRDRNKIAHGGGKRDQQFYSDLKYSLIKIQHLVAEILKKRMNVELINAHSSIIDLPIIVYSCKKAQVGYNILNSDFSAMAAISMVNNTSKKATKQFSVDIGLWTEVNKNPIFNPDFVAFFFPDYKKTPE